MLTHEPCVPMAWLEPGQTIVGATGATAEAEPQTTASPAIKTKIKDRVIVRPPRQRDEPYYIRSGVSIPSSVSACSSWCSVASANFRRDARVVASGAARTGQAA